MSTLAEDKVLLPHTATAWIVSQPDEVLGSKESQRESLQSEYTLSNHDVSRYPRHEHVIRTDLVRQLGNLTLDIMDELSIGFDETWGMDSKEWKSIPLHDNMVRVIARTSNRVFVGAPLCRNDTYLTSASNYAGDIVVSATLISQVPVFLRPLLAPIITIPNKLHWRQFRKHLDPVIEGRLAKDPEKEGGSRPNDLLQWSIQYARDQPFRDELTPRMLAGRLAVSNFAAIHTSSITISNTIFDLASSDPSKQYIQQLREEVETVLAEENGVWSKKALSRMHKTDSALRESMRLNSMSSISLIRRVMAKEGLTAPDGTHIPYGAEVATCSHGIHHDAANYTNPNEYDPLRYVRQRNDIDESDSKNTQQHLRKANLAMVSTNEEFHSFGLGKHACPGRFFAANELKLLLAYMVMNYDIEPLKERPGNTWVGTTMLPPTKACINVRRRELN